MRVEIHESLKHVSDSNHIGVHKCMIDISRREGISRGTLNAKVKWNVKAAELHRERDTDTILFNLQKTFPANFIHISLLYVYFLCN